MCFREDFQGAPSSVSVSGPEQLAYARSNRCRMISGEPPGSRVTMVRSMAAFSRSPRPSVFGSFWESD
jgi:hypothetical protein